ncbi:unnamed protein product [Cuscuta epithymum]|uniref:Polygalacturonase n=1 Tax=Cuscuta epithymum TaxID=186058 RepID=A0AAV0CQY0_9ASTE|nr:unnamed protein product [Cuscuta epithymum]
MFHITIMGTIKATIRHVKLIAKENAYNTDGIHIQSSSQVTITDSDMETGDDCISIGPDVKTVRIENIDCGPGHGISIGSLGGEGTTTSEVEEIEIRNVRLTETLNGVRIKTWARAASSGFVKNVWVQDVTMDNVWNPILIDQRYCSKPDRQLCFPGEESGIMISNVTFVDIKGTSETAVGVKLDCSRAQPCQDIALNPADVSLTYNGAPAKASCANVQCPIGFPRF